MKQTSHLRPMRLITHKAVGSQMEHFHWSPPQDLAVSPELGESRVWGAGEKSREGFINTFQSEGN